MDPRFRRWQWRIFASSWLAYAGLYLCRKNLSVLMPLLGSERGVSKFELANIVFAYSLCYAAGQFIVSPLSDRFGGRRIVTIGLAVAALSNIFMGFTGTYVWLLVLGMVNGLAQSAGWPGLVKAMAAWFRPSERGVVMGWWTTNYVVGGFLATIFASWVIGNSSLPMAPWARGFVLPAMLLLGIAVCFALLARGTPADAGLPMAAVSEDEIVPASYRALLARPAVWVTAITALVLKIIRYSFLFWLPLYMTEQLHYAVARAGYTASIYELAGAGGALLAGYLSDRLFESRRFPVASIMLVGLAGACSLHAVLAGNGWIGNLIGIALIGVMTYGPDTLMQGPAAQDIGSREAAASAAGLVCGIASLGQLISPYLVAVFAARFGWDGVFRLFVLLALAAAAISGANWNFRPIKVQLVESS